MSLTLRRGLRNDPVGSLHFHPIVSVGPEDTVRDAVLAMRRSRTGCVLIVEPPDGRLVGVFTERDLVSRVLANGSDLRLPVARVMTASPHVLRRTSSLQEALELIDRWQVNHLPVVDDRGCPEGVVSVRDVVHYLVEYFPAMIYNLPDTPDVKQPAREGA